MPLTDAALRTLKPGATPRKVADEKGLYIYIAPNGSKLWRYGYRDAGRQKLLSFGPYPEVGLADERLGMQRALLRDGSDPSVQKRLDKLAKADADASLPSWLRKRSVKAKQKAPSKSKSGFILRRSPISATGQSALSPRAKFSLPCALSSARAGLKQRSACAA